MASAAWDAQLEHLAEGSRFYARKFKEAGIGASTRVRLADITRLPFTTKDELKQSVDEQPPFGTASSACIRPAARPAPRR